MSRISRLQVLLKHMNDSRGQRNCELSSTSTSVRSAQDVLNTRRQIQVLNSTISYLDTGTGDNVVIFLHGNPTSAYLWRNVIPHVSPIARCLAPDLVGMGRSGKDPNSSYRFVDHYKYLEAWIDHMTLPQTVTIVGHDWGSALGFHWCNLHRDRVQAVVFMEALVDAFPTWDDWPESAREIFQMLRTDQGATAVLENNVFVEGLLPSGIIRQLSEEEMKEYLHPYSTPGESRRPTLTWPREIPVASVGPTDVVQFARDYNAWLSKSRDVPKLYIDAEPGFLSDFNRKRISSWPNLKKARPVRGHHFVQEDSPDEVGQAISQFLRSIYAN